MCMFYDGIMMVVVKELWVLIVRKEYHYVGWELESCRGKIWKWCRDQFIGHGTLSRPIDWEKSLSC